MLSPVRTSVSGIFTSGPRHGSWIVRSALLRVAFVRHRSTDQHSISSTSYPFPLYFHLLPSHSHIHAPTTSPASDRHSSYAVSFLPTFPKHNRQVIGYLSHSPSSTSELQVQPNKFTENEAFNTVLHTVIQQHLGKDPVVESVLQQQLEG